MNFKLIYTVALFILLLPALVVAAEPYQPLVGIPNVDDSGDINGYINALYALSISIAALLAVIKIIIAGVKWMLSDIVTDKSEAKKDIWNATIGLLIVIAAVLILGVINPQLTSTNVFVDEIQPTIPPQSERTDIKADLEPGQAMLEVDGGAAGENRCVNDPTRPGGEFRAGAGANGQGICIYPEPPENFEPLRPEYKCTMVGQGEDGQGEYDCGQAEAKCEAANGIPEVAQSLEVVGGANGGIQDRPRVVACYPISLPCEFTTNNVIGATGMEVEYRYSCNNQRAKCKDGQGTEENGMMICG